jgi:hypothetical protein
MSPLEAAVLVLSIDLRNVLRFAGELKRQGGELKRQGETLESFARLQGRHGKRENRHLVHPARCLTPGVRRWPDPRFKVRRGERQ